MNKESKGGFAKLDDDSYRLSDGRVLTETEMDQALENYCNTEELKDAEDSARRNRENLEMLYTEVARISQRGHLLKDQGAQAEVKAAIDIAHGEVLGDTYAMAVADVEHMSAVTLAALMPSIDAVERHYREAARKGQSVPRAIVGAPILLEPTHIEGVEPENFVQAMIVASIVKWLPMRGYLEGKWFFVTPASKDWDVLEKLDATPEGKDWIDMAYARSEHTAEDTLPDL